jgi:hypothetical protein
MKVLNLRRATSLIAGAALFTVFATVATAQTQVANPNLIPAKSAYVVSVPDTKAFWNAWKGNAIYASYQKAMANPEISQKMSGFNKELQTIESVLGYKLSGESMSQIFSNAAIYLGPGENAGSRSMGAILGVADKDKLNKLLDLAEKAAASAVAEQSSDDASTATETETRPSRSGKGKAKPSSTETDGQGGADDTETTSGSSSAGPISSENYSGVTVKRFTSGEDNEVYYALAGDLLLLSNDRGEMKALVDRSKASSAAGGLASIDSYKKVTDALAARPGEAYLFGSQKEAVEMQAGGGMDALREITQQLSPVEFYGSSVKFEPKQITHYSYGLLSGDTSNSLVGKHPGDKPLEAIKYVPAETLFAFGTSLLDSDVLYKMFTDAAGSKSVEDQLKSAELMLGFSVKNDLIPALGNELALGINSVKISGGAPSVDAALVMSVRDTAKMQKVLSGLEKLATNAMAAQASSSSSNDTESNSGNNQGGADDENGKKSGSSASGSKKASSSAKEQAPGFKELKVGDKTIHYVESPAMYGMTPGYVLDGDFLVLGSTKEAMQAAMEVKSGAKSIAESEAVKALGPRISTTGNVFQYLNFSGVWTTVDAFAKTMLNPTLATGFEAVKVLKTAAGVSSLKDGAVVSEGVLLLQ